MTLISLTLKATSLPCLYKECGVACAGHPFINTYAHPLPWMPILDADTGKARSLSPPIILTYLTYMEVCCVITSITYLVSPDPCRICHVYIIHPMLKARAYRKVGSLIVVKCRKSLSSEQLERLKHLRCVDCEDRERARGAAAAQLHAPGLPP